MSDREWVLAQGDGCMHFTVASTHTLSKFHSPIKPIPVLGLPTYVPDHAHTPPLHQLPLQNRWHTYIKREWSTAYKEKGETRPNAI